MSNEKFRRQLDREARLWCDEGLIDAEQYNNLAQRYQFDSLATSAKNRFVMILIGLGSILIGLGLITFVAANWEQLSKTIKVIILLTLFIVISFLGFNFWKQNEESKQRFGQGLLILASLILGANLGLMSQIFHLDGASYELFMAWAIGVAIVAYSLQISSLGILAFILMGFGYWGFWGEFQYQNFNNYSWSSFLGEHMPMMAILFVSLAYWCRSRVLFVLSCIAIVSAILGNLQPLNFSIFYFKSTSWILAIAFALPPALLWAYDDNWLIHNNRFQPLQRLSLLSETSPNFSYNYLAQIVSLWYLGFVFYFASSSWFWQLFSKPNNSNYSSVKSGIFIDIIFFAIAALFFWLHWFYLAKTSPRYRNSQTIIIGILIIISALVPFWHSQIENINFAAVFIFNLLLFIFSAGLIRAGLSSTNRMAFWGGMLLLTLRIMSWFFLSSSDLLFKSLAFILCGFAVIILGIWFEKKIVSR